MSVPSGEERVGILLAGGSGSRLFPMTAAVNKQLLPVYDKPMIYYPLSTLMLTGIREFVVVSQPDVIPHLRRILADGSQWGIEIRFAIQERPEGLAHGLIAADEYVRGRHSALILGDNILYGTNLPQQLRIATSNESGATIFAYPVSQPQVFGVVTLDPEGRPVSLEEKPTHPTSHLAIPGLYFYDGEAVSIARNLKRSRRGELEITELNKAYMERGKLKVERLGRGTAWLDGGTPEDLFEAAQFVRVMEERTGLKIACLEEIAYRMGYISLDAARKLASVMPACSYRAYLDQLTSDAARSV